MLSIIFLFETMHSTIAMPLFCLDLGYPSGSHWRLIGFFSRKPKEKDEVGKVATGKNVASVLRGSSSLIEIWQQGFAKDWNRTTYSGLGTADVEFSLLSP
ncbi:hypothetical protein SLEP1_g45858 [Rubroshorea leprosula]|uniref:Uncharacterized protein n=1 Tax=Rubroshorea leprosula TaxID=152421 RepID=A0AAV5LL70_9ROSI|nr:hypothetical protein SLEP1_g45858 [Rubroshorea leprosula]